MFALKPIPLSSPSIAEEDIAAVVSVLRTPRLSLGPCVPEFERAIAAYIGAKHAVAVNSGTSALHLIIRALKISEGDEVITTPYSFVSSANCMLFERAIPRFVDILPDTFCIDPSKIEAAITPKTKAILGVDVFGYLADWDRLRAIAKKHGLALIEDSCEALGSKRNGTMAGTFGDCGTFAFYPNKQMTTGEGGIIVTDRDDIAASARAQRNQGRDPEATWLEHRELGFNYRLSDINCALGTSQLKRLPEFISKRAQIVSWYAEALAPLREHLQTPAAQKGVDVSWFVYVVRLQDASRREDVMQRLRDADIGCANYFPCIHLQPFYRAMFGFTGGEFPVAEDVSARSIALPFFTGLTQEQVKHVAAALTHALH